MEDEVSVGRCGYTMPGTLSPAALIAIRNSCTRCTLTQLNRTQSACQRTALCRNAADASTYARLTSDNEGVDDF